MEAVAAAPAPGAAPRADGTTFYRYRDGGRIVIVDSLSRVPSRARGSVETLLVPRAPESIAGSLPELSADHLHWPSFAAGAACVLIAGLAWLGLRRIAKPGLRWSVLGGLVLLGAGAYFGWLRRVTGQSGSLVSSPAALIDDARSAVEKMNRRTREQERVLRELESQR